MLSFKSSAIFQGRIKALWKAGPAPELRAGDVHVWLARLDLAESHVTQLRCLLSDDEQTRADRFYFERDRRRFVVARGTLRSVLAQYVKRPPENIQFGYEAAGKPYLISSGDAPQLFISMFRTPTNWR